MGEFITFLGNNLADFWTYTGFANATGGHLVMILVGLFFIVLSLLKVTLLSLRGFTQRVNL
jgi:carboxybiotin decarboxylase